ncbi:MAG: PAS domain-containing protein [Campylobacterales bacterium]|nr:PAS domain-containing protein [Campylobacterales bacterium]
MSPQSREQEFFFPNDRLLVSKTDTRGITTYANEAFIAIAGYSEEELIGKPHNLVRHPDMPKVIFKMLWGYLNAGSEINAYVKNRTKSGGYYWVLANVTPSRDVSGKTIGFHSARRNPSKEALEVIKPLYAQLLDAERSGGLTQSETVLERILNDKGVSYEEFVLSF